MPAIVRSARVSPPPVEVIKDSVELARMQGLRVRIGSPGVVCVSTHGARHWEVDPLERDGAIDPIGAVLLAEQPPACELHDAARLALDVPRAWVDGVCAGMALEAKDPAWMASPKRNLFLHGFETGVTLRIHVLSSQGSES